MSDRVHRVAREGFGRAADAYERGRPGYPPDAVAWLIAHVGAGPSSRLVDLAAGTGKLTAQLVEAGLRPLAVEPVEAMREALAARLPGVDAVEGTAERMPLDDGSADAVAVGQAFHWFDGEAALHEIARVLRPGGGLALIWNRRDESVPWVRALSELMEAHRGDVPRYGSGAWRRAFDQTTLFAPLEHAAFRHLQELTPAGVRDRVLSVSFISALPADELEVLLRRVDELVADVDRTPGGETVELPYVTDVWACRRRGA